MLCCLGFLAGFAIGSMFGGPWMFIAPVMGFALGLIGDRKLMHRHHGSHGSFKGGCCGGGHTHNEEVKK
jgi:hypothetical protein